MRDPFEILSAVIIVSLPLVLAAPKANGPVLVLAAPGSPADAVAGIVAAADGMLLRGTTLSWAVVARSDGSDFAEKLRRAGAWAVIDASRVVGCLEPGKDRGRIDGGLDER